ncbi:MAG: 16S rRNA (adenine(1518)-N(6)/adenine(1519)-N(6))-dimethyltransferase RsmA [Firmicutes bacterium]|nr:16S rRNA (adenine(1518)-N(6)/adenine(1519)-N(6))-dimethyltransferase RsmA [Bacillota bacterium]
MKKIGTQSEVAQTVRDNEFRIKKHYGQNFLVDQNILENIIKRSKITKETFVIEIGPGFGSLTEKLVKTASQVLAYEIDRDLIPILNDNFCDVDNLILVNEDILKIDIDKDIEKYIKNEEDIVVISNLPYYITTPILMKFLETSKRVKKLVLMMQYEVAKRITSAPNTKDYNALSVVIQYRAHTSILFKVPKTVFIPAPNVDSAVILVELKNDEEKFKIDESFFFAFVHFAFAQRRKTLINNLLQGYPNQNRIYFEALLTNQKLNLTVRAEALSLEQLLELANALQLDEK